MRRCGAVVETETFPAPRGQTTDDSDQVGNMVSMTDANGTVTYGYGPTNHGEPNPYTYAACNPANNTDPSGMFSVDWGSVGWSCAAGAVQGGLAGALAGGASAAVGALAGCSHSVLLDLVGQYLGQEPAIFYADQGLITVQLALKIVQFVG